MTLQGTNFSPFRCVPSELAWPDHSSQSCFLMRHQLFPMMTVSTVCVRQGFIFLEVLVNVILKTKLINVDVSVHGKERYEKVRVLNWPYLSI